MTPKEIAARVPMSQLLGALGFEVNECTHRAACILHGGRNRTAFSFNEDGAWYCFQEGIGGDRIALVQAARKQGFHDALGFIANLAGVPLHASKAAERAALQPHREMESWKAKAIESLCRERALRLALADEVRSLERIRDGASTRLRALWQGAPEHRREATETAWCALRIIAERLPVALAGYYLLAFGSEEDRFRFTHYPQRRDSLTERVVLAGGTITMPASSWTCIGEVQ
jgi:hypothetical protein